ncbi:transposase [Vibrio parahaemolyticus]|nr:transposase [Vibrio parahaemolyticus]EJE8774703.1 transposase [Vibrio parahaemolyticus]
MQFSSHEFPFLSLHERRDRSNEFINSAIETALMLKGIFNLPLHALQICIDWLFSMMGVDLRSPNYTSISKRVRTLSVDYLQPPKNSVDNLVIDAYLCQSLWRRGMKGSQAWQRR